jgi:hypothetical protein
MVRIVDEGSHFDAPIDKLWKMIELHGTEIAKIHPNVKNPKMESVGENQGMISFDSDMGGHTIRMKMRVTALPPLAQTLELLEGPLAGSKFVNYYTPKGDKTAVTVVGDFQSKMLSPAQLEGAAHEFLNNGFDEDQAYLKRMR